MKPVILSILELGGYPDFSRLYQSLGYDPVIMPSMRKATRFLKSHDVDIIVAEFNFQSDFRDRSSQLETLMASIAQKPQIEVVVFYDMEQSHLLNRVTDHFNFLATLSYPIDEAALETLLRSAKVRICPS